MNHCCHDHGRPSWDSPDRMVTPPPRHALHFVWISKQGGTSRDKSVRVWPGAKSERERPRYDGMSRMASPSHVRKPSLPPCGVKTIRWKPSELGCHRPSPSSQSWTSMSMPITMGGSSSARCVFLLLLFVPNGSSAPCDHNQVGGLLILTYRMSVSYLSWVTFGW